MTTSEYLIEAVGWISTTLFLISIVVKERSLLHALGVIASITTGIYAYAHGATAIWVKWLIALFFHSYMWLKISRDNANERQRKIGISDDG